LFVSDYPHLPDIRGGLQTTTHDLCLAIGMAGAEAAVLCGLQEHAGEGGDTLPRSDESLGYLCMRAASPERALPLVAAAWNPSAIVVQSGTSLLPLVLASLNTGRATAVYLHNVETHQLHGTLVPDPSLLYLSNSGFTAERWRALCGLHCEVILPVVRAEGYLAGGMGGRKVLFVNPTPIKGVELMFALAAQCPDLEFLVVESWALEPNWRQLCRHRAQRLGNVEWRGPTDDMRPVFGQCRALLMPSVWEESFGRTVVEAQLNGLPVLASNRGALPVNVGEGGLTLDPHAPVQAWEQALRRLLAAHGNYSEAARQNALGHVAATPLIVGRLLGLLATHAAR
ncbi:MAG: glycosyltransferase, partial [Comamonadaceae bacterium]